MNKLANSLSLRAGILSAALAVFVPAVQADPVGQLTTFAAGTPARASEINANFDAIKTTANNHDGRIAALEAQIAQISRQIGFAHINTVGTTSTIGTFAGVGTAQASVIRAGVGVYNVTFTGTYPASIAPGKIVLLSTATSDNFEVTNNVVLSANASTIVVRVFTFQSNTLTSLDDSFDVLVLLGD